MTIYKEMILFKLIDKKIAHSKSICSYFNHVFFLYLNYSIAGTGIHGYRYYDTRIRTRPVNMRVLKILVPVITGIHLQYSFSIHCESICGYPQIQNFLTSLKETFIIKYASYLFINSSIQK